MAKRGAKPLVELDPTLLQRLADDITAGLTDEMAYSRAGISHQTFYRWLKEKSEFSELIAQAREKAKVLAVVAFKSGLMKSETEDVITETFTETRTRLNKAGEVVPYEYTRTKVERRKSEHPPDWRAGEAWLKRRDAANWSDKLTVEVDTKQLELLLELLKQANIKPSDAFELMIQKLAANSEIGTPD